MATRKGKASQLGKGRIIIIICRYNAKGIARYALNTPENYFYALITSTLELESIPDDMQTKI